MLDVLRTELRYAIREAWRSRGLSVVAILTLALGVGATTALFSVVYGALLRPLDYRQADRLIAFHVQREFAGRAEAVPAGFSLYDLETWKAKTRALASVALVGVRSSLVTTAGGSEVIDIATVTPSFFSTVDGHVVAGRGLGPADDLRPVVAISERFWQRAFHGDLAAVGRQLVVDGQPHTIVGVLSRSFQVPQPDTQVWRPAGFARTMDASLGLPGSGGFQVVARLQPGATIADAQRDGEAVARAVDPELQVSAEPLRDLFVGAPARRTVLILFGAVGLLLVVSCANVAHLLLARQAGAVRELAVRAALGASRGRLAIQSASYAAVIAGAGSLAGVVMAGGIVRTLVWLEPAGLPRLDAVRTDAPVLIFAIILAGFTTFAISLLPVCQSAPIATVLRSAALRTTDDRTVRRVRRVLVAAEMAVAIVLLVVASLLGRSLTRLLHAEIGVAAEGVSAALIEVSFGRPASMDEQRRTVERVVDRVRAVPGLVSVGAGASLPPNRARLRLTMRTFEDAGGERDNYMVDAVTATPGYFTTLGLRLRSGRLFTEDDRPGSPEVMIVTASTARQLFGAREPLGRSIRIPVLTASGAVEAPVMVVGVVDDVKYSGLGTRANPVIYRPFAQQPWRSMFIVVRSTGGGAPFEAALRREIAAVDPGIGVLSFDTLDSLIAGEVAQPRARAVVLAGLAALALALAAVGLYGVMAYATAQRTAEVGVRLAVGAQPADVTRLFVREGLWTAAIGAGAGAAAALAATRLVRSMLYDVAPTDAASFGGSLLFLLAVAWLASYVPARKASRLHPARALRQE